MFLRTDRWTRSDLHELEWDHHRATKHEFRHEDLHAHDCLRTKLPILTTGNQVHLQGQPPFSQLEQRHCHREKLELQQWFDRELPARTQARDDCKQETCLTRRW